MPKANFGIALLVSRAARITDLCNVEAIEKVQTRATKLLSNIKDMTYEKRLQLMNLQYSSFIVDIVRI